MCVFISSSLFASHVAIIIGIIIYQQITVPNTLGNKEKEGVSAANYYELASILTQFQQRVWSIVVIHHSTLGIANIKELDMM